MSHLPNRLFHRLVSHLYRDTNGDASRGIVVAGAARSGTTWLAEIIASQLACRIMFEPFHPYKVKAFSAFDYFHYQRPSTDNAELLAYCNTVLHGRIRHPWIDREVATLRPDYRLIKEIRANLFLKWIQLHFPQTPLLFIMRHPCAVVLSRLQLQWATDSDIESFLHQPQLVEDFLADKMDIIAQATSDAAKHALIWCISNIVPLQQFASGELPIVFYEHLIAQPDTTIPALFQNIGITDYEESVYQAAQKPSATSKKHSAIVAGTNQLTQWQSTLTNSQIDDVLAIVAAFNLDIIYDDLPMPRIGKVAGVTPGKWLTRIEL
ncbi:MAG TPA: sulfotransferase [Chloroflexota bacterium]|nr:sulfotransferase [Chloroflexota bacterium]